MFTLQLLKTVVGKPVGVAANIRTMNFKFARSFSQNAPVSNENVGVGGQTHFGYQTINENEKEEKGKENKLNISIQAVSVTFLKILNYSDN